MEQSILQKVKETERLFEGYEIIGSELARVTALRKKLEELKTVAEKINAPSRDRGRDKSR